MNTALSKCGPRGANRGVSKVILPGSGQPIDEFMVYVTTYQPMTCRTTNCSCKAIDERGGRRSCASSDTYGADTQLTSDYTSFWTTGALTRNTKSCVGLEITTSVWSTLPRTHPGSIRSKVSSLASNASSSVIPTSSTTKKSVSLSGNTPGGETQTHPMPN